ncbi:hypothetical protein ALO63_200045 [Pseudomonas amygdali pv. mori]|uniref:Uncharacterized protein n=1 Tax=Pseudomonas amygdali pv. mori TaxID=34065 RepID=A0A0P9UT97_PSEA0|nr:hypothetical protein ALO63_200045 [Pseudomonas amygdali pv. mori]
MLRKTFSVVIEKTARELAGTACLELDEVEPPRQEIGVRGAMEQQTDLRIVAIGLLSP